MGNVKSIFFLLIIASFLFSQQPQDPSMRIKQLEEKLGQPETKEKAIQELFQIVKSSPQQTAVLATEALKKAPKQDIVNNALELSLHSDKNVVILALEILSTIPTDGVRQRLDKLLRHSEPYVMANAAIAVGKVQGTSSISRLKEMILDMEVHGYARIMAVVALMDLQGEDSAPFLLTQLRDKDHYLRYAIITGLSKYSNQKIQSSFKSHIDWEEKYFVLQELKKLFPEEFVNRPILSAKIEESKNSGIEISVTGPRLLFIYRGADYKITIKNSTEHDIHNYDLEINIPNRFQYITSEPQLGVKYKEGKPISLVTSLKKLEANSTIEFIVNMKANDCGTFRIQATLKKDLFLLEAYADTNSICCVPGMHISTYDTEDPCEVGQQTIYVVEIRNEGTSPCSNVIMENKIPQEMEFISASGSTRFSYDKKSRTVVFLPFLSLESGEKLVYKIVCEAVREGSAKNTAKMSYDEFDRPILDEEGTSVYKED